MKVLNKVNQILFPVGYKCLVCGKEIVADGKFDLCKNCFNKLPKITSKTCNKCGEPINADSKYCVYCKKEMPVFTKCFAPFLFDESIIKLVHDLKYNGRINVAKTLSNFIAASYLKMGIECDLVIPVPLNLRRESERGFNQAELLSESFKNIGLTVDVSSVVRSKNTLTQTNLTKTERKENVENAFTVVHKEKIKGKNILLVDDVYTTGATLNALSKVLKEAGAKEVYGATLAHTIIKSSFSETISK